MDRLTRLCRDTENGKYAPHVFGKYNGLFPDSETSQIVERLAAYEDAEEQGLHIAIPCKVGDTVYGCPYSWTYKGIDEADILDWRVACIHYSINKTGNIKATVRATVWVCEKGKNYALLTEDIPFSDFGKTIFPTPEAAYAALKGGKNNEI